MLTAIDPAGRRGWLAAFAFSAAVHLLLFLGGGWTLFRPAQYGVETGSGGLEVSLVAAPPRPVSAAVSGGSAQPVPADLESGEMVLTEPPQAAPVPGKDPTTFFSQGGGQSDAEPGPFKNPAPPYPLAARRLGQEGSVGLRIAINKIGQPTRVEIQQSSGYPLLDESALATVRRWRFVPARAAGVPRDSAASLRVRFRLKENNEE